jgi:hypothetical protein
VFTADLVESEYVEMAKIDVLEERVKNHIKFFWVAIGAIFAWLAYISWALYGINGNLSNLEGLNGRVAKIELNGEAALPQEEFQETLPTLKTSFKIATEQKIKLPIATVDAIRSKLQIAGPSSPDYWATISAFINYRSAVLTTSNFADLARKDLRNCLDSLPTPGKVLSVDKSKGQFTTSMSHYDNCRLTLDSPHDNAVLNEIIKKFTMIVFMHCLIVYDGGPINVILAVKDYPAVLHDMQDPTLRINIPPVTGKTLYFDDCLIDIRLTGQPKQPGPQLTQTLLAQNDLSGIELPVQASPE